jgi:hypothetical protein
VRFEAAKDFRSTSCAIGWNAKSKDADIVPCRGVFKQAGGILVALDIVIGQDGARSTATDGSALFQLQADALALLHRFEAL